MMITKLTPQQALKRVQIKSPNIIGIVASTYINVSTPCIFIDEIYGEFSRSPDSMWRKGRAGNHPKRGEEIRIKKKTQSVEKIEERLNRAHNGMVTLDRASYVNVDSAATFIDSFYGKWTGRVIKVLGGRGHPQRSLDSQKRPIKEVNEKIHLIHKGNVSLIESSYKGVNFLSIFIDKDYGEWTSTAHSVMEGHAHPRRANDSKRLSVYEYKKKIEKYKDEFILDETTYVDATTKARFIDKDYGEFWARPNSARLGHINRRQEKIKKTNIERYGVAHLSQDPEHSLKIARKLQNTTIRLHWKTGEELVCQASYEHKVVDYLNANRIDFLWQPKTFVLPLLTSKGNNKTYRPDLFLVNSNTWVEIKGWMRPESKPKWDWFLIQFPTAELWDKKKLKEMGIL